MTSMKRVMSRLLSGLLAIVMVVGMVPAMAMPAEAASNPNYSKTGNQVDDVIAVAVAQKGLQWADMQSEIQEECGNGFYKSWCAAFVYWCGAKVGLVENGFYGEKSFVTAICPTLWFLKQGKGTMYCYDKHYDNLLMRTSEGWPAYEKTGQLVKVGSEFRPKKGDIIVFGYNIPGGLSIQHTGYVMEDSQGKGVRTIEGNTGYSKPYGYTEGGVVLRTIADSYNPTGIGSFGSIIGYMRPNWCQHDAAYDETGRCGIEGCRAYKPNNKENLAVDIGWYKVKAGKTAQFRIYPYKVSNEKGQEELKAGTKNIKVTGMVENGLGNNWYKVEYGGKVGYIVNNGNLEWDKALETDITATKLPVPTNHTQGNGFPLNFALTATNCKIATIEGEFCYAGGEGLTVANSVCGPFTINATTYSAGGKAFDNAMKFGILPPGRFFYIVTVTDSNGRTYGFASDEFDVVAKEVAPEPAVVAPTIEHVRSYPGGKTYRIKQYTDGATLTYWYHKAWEDNGGDNYTTTAKSVEIDVKQTSGIAAYSTKNGKSAFYGGAPGAQLTVTIPELEPPVITTKATPKGGYVTISGDGDIYYSIGGGTFQRYTQPFEINAKTASISAYAQKDGYQTSETVQAEFAVTAPNTPSLSLQGTPADVAKGTAINVQWDKDSMASYYVVTVKCDGEEVDRQTVRNKNTATIRAEWAGVYTITVSAGNDFMTSGTSKAVTVTAHAPLTVTFTTDDGTVIGTPQTVEYGGDAKAPPVPAKKGHTFDGWSGNLNNITRDTTIAATYEINKYTVRFYDVDGVSELGKQTVVYNQGIDDTEALAKLNLGAGYGFAGWHISQCESDSAQDFEHIDCNMSLVATKQWLVDDLPIVITNPEAARNADSTGYNVSATLAVANAQILKSDTKKAKILAVLKTETDQMLATEMTTVNLEAGDLAEPKTVSMFISYDGSYLAAKVEISVLGIDGNDRTGGALAEMASEVPTVTVKYSPWMTADQLAEKGKSPTDADVQSKTQYWYTDWVRETATRQNSVKTAPVLEGYTCITKDPVQTWGNWSSWSDTVYTANSNREVLTRPVKVSDAYTEYRYGGYFTAGNGHNCWCKKYLESKGWGSATLQYSPWSKTRYSVYDSGWTCGNCSGSHTGYYGSDGSRKFWHEYKVGGLSYYWEESRYVPEVKKTQYQYRDAIYTYEYEKWVISGKSNDWSDTMYQASETVNSRREVSTQTLYRYQTNDTSVTKMESTAVTRTSAGTLKVAEDLSGKLATILVYKETNSDPTEPQLEYMGQTTIGEGNSYSFTFQTKEEPTTATGDFIVALALQGASNVVNVDKVFSPDDEYTVTFYGFDGSILGAVQTVKAGQAAEHVAPPEVEGYKFLCWDTDTTCVNHDVDVYAIYWPEEYSVVFVDHENETVELRTDYTHGELISAHDTPAYEGKVFAGWQVVSNNTGEILGTDLTDFAVTDDLIVTAQWTPVEYTVTFVDASGNVLKEQTVAHGEAAVPPYCEEVPDEMEFRGWELNNEWWNVTSDMTVYPILTYLETTAAPASSTDTYISGVYSEIELTAEEGATIYYTVDGSDPDPMRVIEGEPTGEETAVTYIYTGPIQVDKTTTIRAISIKANKNDSGVVYIDFVYDEEAEGKVDYYDGIEIGTYNVQAEAGNTVTLSFNIEENPGLIAYAFLIEADPSVFGIKYDEEAYEPKIAAGDVCAQNGTMLVGPYQEGIGWQVLWFGNETAEGDGTLCTIELQVADEAEAGIYPIVVSYSPANTISEEWFEQDVTKKVSIGAAGLLGDVNSDGYITSIDVVRIARYIIDDMSFSRKEQKLADVTGDGNITAADVLRLARYIVGLAELG